MVKKFVKICPNCGSTKIKMPPRALDIKLVFRDYCVRCGHIGNFPEIEEKQIKEFQRKMKKNKQRANFMGSSLKYSEKW